MRYKLHKINSAIASALGISLLPADNHFNLTLVRKLRTGTKDTVFCNNLQKASNTDIVPLLIRHPSVNLFRIDNAFLVGSQGYIFLDNLKYLSLGASLNGVNKLNMMRPLPMLATHEITPLFYLAENSVSRAHAVMEHLSRYQIAREFLPKKTKVIVQNGQSFWWNPYLNCAGSELTAAETSRGTIHAKEVYFVPMPSGVGINLIGEPKHYLELRERALRNIRSEKTPIFISRNDAPRRRLLNEDQIFVISRRFLPDLKRITIDKLSFKEQLEVVANAPVIISPHGQGSHLSLFAQKTVSIQLVPGKSKISNPYYECALFFDYLCSIGENNLTVSYASESEESTQNEDWYYPELKFEREIRCALDFGKPNCKTKI